jgi:hypothetical protein
MDINTLRKMRNSDFGKITGEFEKIANPQSEKSSYQDDRFWKLEPDKAGNASATIRFLPRAEGDELPWVRIFNHGFQGPTGKWYIENSLTTIGEVDPVGEMNSRLWAVSTDDNSPTRKQARAQKRKLTYYANILIISDPKHSENEGQVRLFKFGKKIFDKIMDKAKPTFEDETPVNVFDFWEGADFKLRMRKVDGYPNYDQSVFMEPSAISEDDEKILRIANSQHKLSEFLDRKNFKTYEELSRKLLSVIEGDASPAPSAANIAEDDEEYTAPTRSSTTTKSSVKIQTKSEDEDDDDAMSYFKKIAQGE